MLICQSDIHWERNVLTDSKWRSWLKLATARGEWAECQCSGAWKCFLLVPNSVLAPSISSHSHGHRDWHSLKVLHRALSLLCFSNPQTFDPTPQYFCGFLRCGELAAVFEVFSSFTQVKVTVPPYINTTTEVLQSEFYFSKSTRFNTEIYLNIQILLCRKASFRVLFYQKCYTKPQHAGILMFELVNTLNTQIGSSIHNSVYFSIIK